MGVSVSLNGESDCSEVGAADFQLRARGGQHRFLNGVHQHVEDPSFLEGFKSTSSVLKRKGYYQITCDLDSHQALRRFVNLK